MRFRLGRAQVIGGWESLMSPKLTGICRRAFPWTDNASVLNIAFGTHQRLQLWRGGALHDVTPYGPPARLGADPLTTANASATVTVSHVGHGRTTGQSVLIAGAVDTNGIAAANLNGTRTVTVVDDDHYTFVAGANATSAGAGGGSAVIVTPQVVLPDGVIDGSGSIGFGTGGYGGGPWGITPATASYFPTTWSLQAWGQSLLASPRGGGLYLWSNDTVQRAVAVPGAPTQITHMLVAALSGGYQCFALGTEQEIDGVFNPLTIRHCSIKKLGEWTTGAGTTAREYTLVGGGRIVAGRMMGQYMLVWTSKGLHLGTFTGNLNTPWNFIQIGENCGLLGPNAAVVVGQRAFWVSPDLQFYAYALGGEPKPVPCPIRQDFADHVAASQGDKVVASSNSLFGEVRFDYPDKRDGYENSRYVAICLSGDDAGAWHRGRMARTAFVDAGPSAYPIGVTYDGSIYYHERGQSADGQPLSWFIESADQVLSANSRTIVRGVWPDFKGQVGPVTVTVKSRETPQGEEVVVAAEALAPGAANADLLTSGLLHKVRFEGSAVPTACRIGRPVFDIAPAGAPISPLAV